MEALLFDLIIFDLDGTLVDTFFEVHQSINETLELMNLPRVSMETARKAIGPGPEEFVKILLPHDSLYLADEFAALLSSIYRRYNGKYAEFFSGITEILNLLVGRVPMAVATNKSKDDAMPLAEKLSFAKWFDRILTRDDVPSPKPAPDMLLLAGSVFNVPPECTLMIGDTNNDVFAARAAGIPCCLAKWGYAENQNELAKLCDFSAEKPEHLMNILSDLEDVSNDQFGKRDSQRRPLFR